jgi:general secretion pathway protein A
MYERFFGLRERPFDLTCNPRYLFLTGRHREALSNLQFAIGARKALSLLVGEAGTGKTTVVCAALEAERREGSCFVHLTNPSLTRGEFFEFLADSFGLSGGASLSKGRFLLELKQQVLERHAAGGFTALVVDEAQSASDEVLEEIRLIANMETTSEKLLPVILVGQPELSARLNEQSLRQLKQRIALRCELGALSLAETAAYVDARLRVAGGISAQIFDAKAIVEIHRRSRGIPRVISVICDNALVSGFAVDVRPVTREIVEEVCRDFDLPAPGVPPDRVPQSPTERLSPQRVGSERVAHDRRERAAREQPTETSPTARPRQHGEASGQPLFSHFTTRRRFSFF